MSKGRKYQLVDVEGCRVVHVPLSAWSALTGIITDNQYQFEADCYATLVGEVVNMACSCLPYSYHYYNTISWSTPGLKVLNVPGPGPDVKRRISHLYFYQLSTGGVDLAIYAVANSFLVGLYGEAGVPTATIVAELVDVYLDSPDYIRFAMDVEASTGIAQVGIWGAEWTA